MGPVIDKFLSYSLSCVLKPSFGFTTLLLCFKKFNAVSNVHPWYFIR